MTKWLSNTSLSILYDINENIGYKKVQTQSSYLEENGRKL